MATSETNLQSLKLTFEERYVLLDVTLHKHTKKKKSIMVSESNKTCSTSNIKGGSS